MASISDDYASQCLRMARPDSQATSAVPTSHKNLRQLAYPTDGPETYPPARQLQLQPAWRRRGSVMPSRLRNAARGTKDDQIPDKIVRTPARWQAAFTALRRSEERRVGKECPV